MNEILTMPLIMILSGLYSAQYSCAVPVDAILHIRAEDKITPSSISSSNCTYNNGIKICTLTKTQGIIVGVCVGVGALAIGGYVIWSIIRKRKGAYQKKLEGAHATEKSHKKPKSHGGGHGGGSHGGGHGGHGSNSSHSSRAGSHTGSRSSPRSSSDRNSDRNSDRGGGQEETKEERTDDGGAGGDSGGGDNNND